MKQLLLILILGISFNSCSNEGGTENKEMSKLDNEIIEMKDEIKKLESRISELEKGEKPVLTNAEPKITKKPTNCDLDNQKYVRSGYSYYLRFYNQKDNVFDLVGNIDAIDITGKIRVNGNRISIISGNFTGELTLLSNCRQLTGSMKRKKYGDIISVDFIKR